MRLAYACISKSYSVEECYGIRLCVTCASTRFLVDYDLYWTNSPLLIIFISQVISQRSQRSTSIAAAPAQSLDNLNTTRINSLPSTRATDYGMRASYNTRTTPSSAARVPTIRHSDALDSSLVRSIPIYQYALWNQFGLLRLHSFSRHCCVTTSITSFTKTVLCPYAFTFTF
jgi:hypothetical protein